MARRTGLTFTAAGLAAWRRPGSDAASESHQNIDFSGPDFPTYTRAEVAKHKTAADGGIWVTYRNGVFDIQHFVDNHPGGNKILLAAGAAIDPYWRIYQQHSNSKLPMELLREMQIGVVDPNEKPLEVDTSDPYAFDPTRHPGLKFHNTKPCNAEIPAVMLMDNWQTPSELFFIRHHHPVPKIKAKSFKLSLEGLGVQPIVLTYEDLRSRFPSKTVTTTIQCGGNRRGDFAKVDKASGIQWGFGAISTAKWEGVLLRDVLMYGGLLTPERAIEVGVRHIHFEGADGLHASIPIEKALSPYGDTLLAYRMNDETLPEEHGYPIRLIVPGVVGVRNVKWVQKVVASEDEAEGPWQRGIAYKGFSPSIKSFEGVDVEKVLSIQEQPVTSVIVDPQEGSTCDCDDTIGVKGFAWSGGGRGIVRVDLSIDGGVTWHEAELGEGAEQHPSQAWAWTFWSAELPLPSDTKSGERVQVICKATDAAYNTQPENAAPIWNARGLNNNSWHRVSAVVDTE